MSDLVTITEKIKSSVGEDSGLGKIVKLDFGDAGKILINAAQVPNVVSNDDGAADTTVIIGLDDLVAMAKGQLDPMMAFMQGKMKILGDMSVAQKLAPLLKG
ncbi:SCP2 sterol-binding domain-containing protein [Asticcacaulis sp. ZE23SCel15]|uniref:SCP2 sterol-binding domain-containing protein n=1 Tax=unclassified Asticcacaulis TaxID=2628350 RepID=UPI00226CD88A|nr:MULTISPECIES: SCP2 sterol-binding domain-containing protein [unclassified Asticcacaulis]WAC48764.1 SCP2 sterol-binding domain-containing protein [Asticcacaulis sp. SL142]WKL56464.1 SCP2 sterol-binding domain-containing protein [Asticcacaulis sp. ZE23SCel15]